MSRRQCRVDTAACSVRTETWSCVEPARGPQKQLMKVWAVQIRIGDRECKIVEQAVSVHLGILLKVGEEQSIEAHDSGHTAPLPLRRLPLLRQRLQGGSTLQNV